MTKSIFTSLAKESKLFAVCKAEAANVSRTTIELWLASL